jgi:hypothetical protein
MHAAGFDSGGGDSLVTLHQNLICHSFSSPFYLDNTVGTHHVARGAADTLIHIGALDGMMTLFVDLVCGDTQDALGAGVHTQSATLAVVGLECQFCHIHFPFFIILYKMNGSLEAYLKAPFPKGAVTK